MSYLQLGRLVLGPPPTWHEAVGDPVTNLGGAAIPAPRQALRHMVDISTFAGDGDTDTLVARLTIRRQLRSLLNNTPLKLQSYLYVIYSDDPEQNGWYVPDFGTLTDISGSVGLASGVWLAQQIAWIMAGHKRINRSARNIWMKDLRLGESWRDFLKFIYSTDFNWLPALQLSIFPSGANTIMNAINGIAMVPYILSTGRDGGTSLLITGQPDLACISFEQLDSQWGLSDVIVYDRCGTLDAPSGGPDSTWTEAYGPDFAWYWTLSGPNDIPVLDNGLVRVRYDQSVGNPGFKVDVWNGSSYIEQGKMCVQNRYSSGIDNTWLAASLMEYTPDRVVILCTLGNNENPYYIEKTFITMQRGQMGVTFELYPSPTVSEPADGCLLWQPTPTDLNETIIKIDSQGATALPSWTPGLAGTAALVATAGTGSGSGNSGQLPSGSATLGNANFSTSENWVSILRCPTTYNIVGPYQHNLIVTQAANAYCITGSDYAEDCYGSGTDLIQIRSNNNAGYIQAKLFFTPTASDQVNEAESLINFAIVNLIPDPSFEYDTLGDSTPYWTAAIISGAGTISQTVINTWSESGSKSLKVSGLGMTYPGGRVAIYPTSAMSASAGLPYSATQTIYQYFGGMVASLSINFYNSSSSLIGTSTYTAPTSTPGETQTLSLTDIIAPANTAYINIEVINTPVADGACLFYIDAALGVQSPTLPGYVDGDTAEYHWYGTAGDSVTISGSTTVSVISDSSASGGETVKDTQNSNVNPTLEKTTDLPIGTYRCFVRAKVASGYSGYVAWYLGALSSWISITSTTYIWLDLGELSIATADPILEVIGYITEPGGAIYIDRVELFRLVDPAMYLGVRDQAQASLMDSRQLGALVAR